MEEEKQDLSTMEKKKRKTLDEYLGINGLLIVAIIGALLRESIIAPIATVCGLVAIYYLIKKRYEIDKKQKYIGWGLVLSWLILFGFNNQQ